MPLETARAMLPQSCHLSRAGAMYPGSVLPEWLWSTLQTASCTSGTAAGVQVGTSDVPGTGQSQFTLPSSLDLKKHMRI